MASCSRRKPSTGCTRPNRSQDWTGELSFNRAARFWAARVRSTACCMCAASTRITIAGASAATPAGALTMCCPISGRPKINSAAPINITAPTVRCRCRTGGIQIRCRKPLSWPPRRPVFRPIPTSMARARKAPDFSRPRRSAAGAPARPIPICVPPKAEAICTSRLPRWPSASCSRDAGRGRSNTGKAMRCGPRGRAGKFWSRAAHIIHRNCCSFPASVRRSF